MNSNEQQKGHSPQSGSKKTHFDFDQQLKDRLEDAAVPPPPNFFENIQAELKKDKEQTQKMPLKEKHTDAPTKQIRKVKIIPIKGFGRKWNYAASIGVLILLSLGFWKLQLFTGKDQPITDIVNPNALLSSKQGAEGASAHSVPAQPARPGIAGNKADLPGEVGVDDNSSPSKPPQIESNRTNPEVSNTKIARTKAFTKKRREDAAARIGSNDRQATRQVSESNLSRNHAGTIQAVENNNSDNHNINGYNHDNADDNADATAKGAVGEITDKTARIHTAPFTKQDAFNEQGGAVKSLTPIQPQPVEPGTLEQSSKVRVVKAAMDTRRTRQTARSEKGGKEKRGLFRGLVHHFKDRVEEISDEIVDEDINKTRIKFGCIAITTYK